MSTFKPNDKVVCIDATPIPIGAPGNSFSDFDFPNGYIEEGTIYCVRSVAHHNTGPALYIVGPSVLLNGVAIPWNGQRFRKVARNKQRKKKAAKKTQPKRQHTST